MSFDAPSDMGGYGSVTACANLLSIDLSPATICQWNSDAKTLQVLPSASDMRFNIGSYVFIKGNNLRARCPITVSTAECSLWPPSATQQCKILAPNTDTIPVVSISAPSSVGPCDDFLVDLSASTGFGGRDWTSFVVSVNSTQGVNTSDIVQFFSTLYNVNKPAVLLPKQLLQSGANYVMTFTLCNYMGGCASGKHTLAVFATAIPVVAISGSYLRTMRSGEVLILYADEIQSTCQQDVNTYTWAVYNGNILASSMQNVVSVAALKSVFTLNPFSLQPDKSYTVVLTSTFISTGVFSTASVVIKVQSSNIVAVLSKGSWQSVRYGDSLVLDASRSYDPDLPGPIVASASLRFEWACNLLEFNMNMGFVPTPGCGFAVSNLTANALTLFASSEIFIGRDSLVSVKVTDGKGRSDSVAATVSMLSALSPKLSLSIAKSKIRQEDKLIVFVSVESEVSSQATWLVSDRSLTLSSVALTPISTLLAPGISTFNLVVRGGSLSAGSLYTFTLVVGSSRSSIDVHVVMTPRGGSLLINPAQGKPLVDTFEMASLKWISDEMPLSYVFGYVDPRDRKSFVVLRSRSEKSLSRSALPSGIPSSSYNVTCTVKVFNALDASTSKQTNVRVRQVSVSAIEINVFVALQLKGPFANDKAHFDATRQIASVTASTLNGVNCSLAPECAVLFREECHLVSHTCGSCLFGYIGTDGHENTRCQSKANNAVKCTADCYTAKSCLLGCSDRGVCIFRRKTSGRVIPTCFSNDMLCEATCVCDEGYFGAGCVLSTADVKFAQATRSLLIDTVKNTTHFQSKTEENVISLVALLVLLSESVEELGSTTCNVLESMSAKIIEDSLSLSLAYEEVKSFPAVLASCLQVYEREGDLEGVANIASLLVQMSGVMKASLVEGQAPSSSMHPGFRIAASSRQNNAATISLYTLRTESETFVGVNASAVVVEPDVNASRSNALYVAIIETQSRFYPNSSNFTSNVLKVLVSTTASSTPNNYDERTTINFVIQNQEYQELSVNFGNETASIVCEEGSLKWINHTCASGHDITHKCQKKRESFTVKCLGLVRRLSCSVLGSDMQLAGAEGSSQCRTTGYTATSVTCECKIANANVRRRLMDTQDTVEKTEEIEVVAMAIFVIASVEDTLQQSSSLSISDLRGSLLVIYMFGALW
jgi:hypothetical protein